MVVSLMADDERVKFTATGLRLPTSYWVSLGLAILMWFGIPKFIQESGGVVSGILAFLVCEAACLAWAYRAIKPYNTAREWEKAGEYQRHDWSPEERRLHRGKLLVHLYRVSNADSNVRVPLEELKNIGGWTLLEVHNLLSPLQHTGIVELDVRGAGSLVDRIVAFSEAKIRLTPTGVLATEDAVTQARQRPGYSVTILGNDNQVQVATVNSEQLLDT